VIGGIRQLQEVMNRVYCGAPGSATELREFLKDGICFLLRRNSGIRDVEDELEYVFAHITHCIRAGTVRDAERLPALIRAVVQNACSEVPMSFATVRKPGRAKVEMIRQSLAELNDVEKVALARYYADGESAGRICASLDISNARLLEVKAELAARCRDGERKKAGAVTKLSSDTGGAVA